MANPAKKLESLLKLHRFELVSQRKHLKYKNPQGKIYVMGKTPSDIRAAHKALTVLERVIANPVPTSEVIEEERLRRELEATITLQAQPKPSIAGIAGAGKGKKSMGTGIYYEEKVVPTAEQLALKEELRQRANANRERKEAKKRERRTLRRANEEWARRLSQFRRSVQQLQKDVADIARFMATTAMLAWARKLAADALVNEPDLRHASAEQRKSLVDAMFSTTQEIYDESSNEEFHSAVDDATVSMTHRCGQLLMRWSGRMPRFLPDLGESVTLTPGQVRMLHLTVAYLSGEAVEVPHGEMQLQRPSDWLCDAVMRLRVGENKCQPEPDCLSKASVGVDLSCADESTSSTEGELVGR